MYHLYVVSVILILILYCFRRHIWIRALFLFYDTICLWGIRSSLEPEYCSGMKHGFQPVMPLHMYAEFNKAIYHRNAKGDNSINRDLVRSICDRNLRWL